MSPETAAANATLEIARFKRERRNLYICAALTGLLAGRKCEYGGSEEENLAVGVLAVMIADAAIKASEADI